VDHRVPKEDPLQFINQLPAMPQGTPIFLITVQHFELQNVIQAIRLGIKDVFHPPLDLKTIVARVQSLDVAAQGSEKALRSEEWSEFVMFLAGGEMPGEKTDPHRGSGKNAVADLSTKLALAVQQRDQLLTERTELKQVKSRLEEQVADLQWEKESAPGAAPARAPVPAAPADETVAAEMAALEQQRAALATQEKALAEAHARFVAEQEEFEAAQLVSEQAQSKVDQVVGELGDAAEKLKQQRIQMATEQRKSNEDLNQRTAVLEAASRQQAQREESFAAEVRQLQEEKASLAARQAALEKASVQLRGQEEEFKQTQAAQKAAHEKTTATLAARAKEFEAKQQQFREQMKQMLAAN
jgi:DNA repair exonuclease SbcCD ATPase subunit